MADCGCDLKGVPYSIRETRAALYQLRDVYHRELYGWLVEEAERLQARVNAEPKRVWVVLVNFGYDGEEIDGVYSTRELAEAAAAAWTTDDAEVREYVVE